MIKIMKVTKKYKGKKILNNFSYCFSNSGLYILNDRSGMGKSTLLNIIGGVDENYDGKVYKDRASIYFKDKNNLVNDLKVKDHLKIFESAYEKSFKYYFNIEQLLNKKIKKLSIGEIQLLNCNMALNVEEKIIIMDEPFSALSYDNIVLVCKEIQKLSKEKLVIIATHNIENFDHYTLVDLKAKKKIYLNEKTFSIANIYKAYKRIYSFIYYKKILFKRLIFLLLFASSIVSFITCTLYLNNYLNNELSFLSYDGKVIEKSKNSNFAMNEDLFYEVVKKIGYYVENYNASYYSERLYNEQLIVNNYYIDNGFALSSFEYTEEYLEENEIIMGFDYHSFCLNNHLFNCDDSYLKTKLINKKIDGYNFEIKDIFDNKQTVVFSNKRFIKIYDEEYVEYYFDIKEENIDDAFYIINHDKFLTEFEYKVKSRGNGFIRYSVDLSEHPSFIQSEIKYSKYLICLEKGYNCLSYLNKFQSLKRVDNYEELSLLKLKVIDTNIEDNEVIISTGLQNKLDKGVDELISLYFEANDSLIKVDLKIKQVIKDDGLCLYHSSNWSYSFFKNLLKYKENDLQIKNIVIYDEPLIEKDRETIADYHLVINEINNVFSKIKRISFLINLSLTCISLTILVYSEIFNNKFKKEYSNYLKMLNIKKVFFNTFNYQKCKY